MRTHKEIYTTSHSSRQIFDLVADVASYPEFIPWVKAARIHSQDEKRMIAELAVHFKAISTRYTSEVLLSPPEGCAGAIDVYLVEGPFSTLENHWKFEPIEGGGCKVQFEISFAFRSGFFERIIGGLFERAVQKMVAAFETRAKELYD